MAANIFAVYRGIVIIVLLVLTATNAALERQRRPTDKNWALHCNSHGRRVYSQSKQDGIIEYVFSQIGVTNKYYVEFGFNSPYYEVGSGSNTYYLHSNFGWEGLLLDGEFSNHSINLQKEWITEDNINEIFNKYNVPNEFDYLSIDLDSTDLWILRSILKQGEFRPRLISVEYNSHFPKSSFLSCVRNCKWDNFRLHGASFGAIQMVAQQFGYTVIAVVKYLDMFLVRNDLLFGSEVPFFSSSDVEGPNHPPSRDENLIRNNVIDYSAFVHSHENATYANEVAVTQYESELENLYKVFVSVPIYIEADDKYLTFDYSFIPAEALANSDHLLLHYVQTVQSFCENNKLSEEQCTNVRRIIRFYRTSSNFLSDHLMFQSIAQKVIDEENNIQLPDFMFRFSKYITVDENSNELHAVDYISARNDMQEQLYSYCELHRLPRITCDTLKEYVANKSGTLLVPDGIFDKEEFFRVMRTNMVL